MTHQQALKHPFCLSLLGHVLFFGIFSFSFGTMLPKAEYSAVSFLGALLRSSDLFLPGTTGVGPHAAGAKDTGHLLRERTESLSSVRPSPPQAFYVSQAFSKPHAVQVAQREKLSFSPAQAAAVPPLRRESVIMFYPQLPYSFLFYFKDRQQVHIELVFNIVSQGQNSSVLIKRKISSGNLEADLLSMRYVDRYLFMQRSRFPPNTWQEVKIDLRPKSE